MTVVPTKMSMRRLGFRQRWDRLRHSDARKALLEEFALWTAVWMGFPLSDKPDLTRKERSRP
jgi:hypothetical protein